MNRKELVVRAAMHAMEIPFPLPEDGVFDPSYWQMQELSAAYERGMSVDDLLRAVSA